MILKPNVTIILTHNKYSASRSLKCNFLENILILGEKEVCMTKFEIIWLANSKLFVFQNYVNLKRYLKGY